MPEFDDKVDNPTVKSVCILISIVLLSFVYCSTQLTSVLTYHVVPGKVMAKDVKAGEVKTVQGSALTIATAGGVTVNNAKVTATDIAASNGVIHVIDTVVMPK